ncbi:MAG: hypothetical protein A2941_01885 [Candidatus Yanofskybacteria bacterium RIFCSPLOWO2_01_FULL_49_17]|uniref:Uncharacterized protein n=1 Tax=Candidatus Yanofskybacteria bacterium RIFCSPLOWO2_01_FULL_49_17 TaxID=1802700 RepID=A0A1F8GUE8_9BACT|nr:MAG: hypothetical protein A2941_01885 [Candidatus Yanofskybacteria bacterium RIFCSPLOWO2_01_FULL_49_17]
MLKKALKLSFVQLPLVPLAFVLAAETSDLPGIDLTIQSLFGILQGLACWMSRFVLVIMVGALIWYGVQMLLSRGNPTAFGNARKSLGYAIIGVVVVLGSYTIIATVGNAVRGAGGGTGPSWNNFLPIDCTNYKTVIY